MNHIANIKLLVQSSRKKLLIIIIFISIIFSIINILLNKNGISTFGILLLLCSNFMFNAYFAYYLEKKLSIPSVSSFFEMIRRYSKQLIKVALFQIVFIIIWVMILFVLSMFKYGIILNQPLTFILYLILNYCNYTILFEIFNENDVNVRNLLDSMNQIRKNLKVFIYIMLKIIAILLVGCIIIYLINIFVYAPQIDATLKAMETFDESLLNPFFSTPLSNFIQSLGAQIISGIALIWIGNTSLELRK